MKPLWTLELNSLDYYLNLKEARIIYVRDLKHQAPRLIKEALERGLKVYSCGLGGGRPTKELWMEFLGFGKKTPVIKYINFYNGVRLLDYTNFDPDPDASLSDMEQLVPILDKYGNQKSPSKIVEHLLPNGLAQLSTQLKPKEKENHDVLKLAFKGGANYILKRHELIPNEIHIDYHQIYAFAMLTHSFPASGDLHEAVGFYESSFSIYAFAPTVKARLRKDGYPLLSRAYGDGMAGEDGEWFYMIDELPYLCDPDYHTFLDNFEVDGELEIDHTYYWKTSFNGSKFKPLIYEFYNMRQVSKGSIKRFCKQINEVLPGFFERTLYCDPYWKTLNAPKPLSGKPSYYNPKVGIFITAYARQMLNDLAHLFPHEKVIGYDTDCVFFAGTISQIPREVRLMFGDEMGRVHEDGNHSNVIHRASKFYYGWDKNENKHFHKQSGKSKSGYSWYWNPALQEYELREVMENEEPR